jgi:Family of unknown function (DUF6940)
MALFEAATDALPDGAAKVRVRWNGAPASTRTALELCRDDEPFRSQLISELARSAFAAYFWETPPITASTLDRPFEFVLTEARALATAAPERRAFAEHFPRDHDDDGVVVFDNLGGDAALVVPCPIASPSAYVHVAAFVRNAPVPQVHALFSRLADEALRRVSERPLWVSTAGMGIFWLHVRLDSTPKYYRHTPYKNGR